MRTIITDNTVQKIELYTDDERAALIQHFSIGEKRVKVIVLSKEERAKVKRLL